MEWHSKSIKRPRKQPQYGKNRDMKGLGGATQLRIDETISIEDINIQEKEQTTRGLIDLQNDTHET